MNSSPLTGPSARLTRLLQLSLVPVAALALSACGGEEETPAESESSVSSTTQESSAPADESSAPANESSAPANESSAPGEESSASEDAASEDPGEEPTSDPSLTGGGEGGALNITSFHDMIGIDKKVDSLSAPEACGYLQGAMANPASFDDPAAGAQGVRDLAKVAPTEVRGAMQSLAATMSSVSGPEDPALGAQLGQVEEACMSAAG
ncbi:hypothetical protein I6I18_11630 [Kytococcus sedentarius]|uniref:DUF732 domain-containing protein n=1 Tax=Kytococcus sedentarius (strain ATCC 14392 / DSM 20547 / JCM 11482 / CCUG 33030 / NBRC 15357 / NCTC 11040 / CCM 314 / 541) TaxID=478801 RepID=C7NIV5_KYTSD|nr:hypothetical protein [Kytococcus sedentarius]ACV05180.1 hypothetical protein Ksed_00850 [Kytococcus sedentarius DSM 20547]QQB63648.1 hypothetical protein I6I18_11630 [Kytococcus sedentarius]STX13415.1 Uncharacterised protein [Kytococcus sedentarius]